MIRLFAGIDPGQSGGFAVLNEEGAIYGPPIALKDMTEDDIADAIAELKLYDAVCALEAVHSMPAQGVASSFKFGASWGVLRGILAACKIKRMYPSPQKWMGHLGCLSGGDKNVTKAAAQRRWPNIKITHAIADALLIAEYCRQIAK